MNNTVLSLGRSARMPLKLVDQAVLKQLNDTCKARGIQVPVDPIDFLNRARVTFLDPDGRPVAVGCALIAWEEG